MSAQEIAPTEPQPAQSGQTHRVINWGGVLKGVAIVAAVAVAAVVGYMAIGAIAEAANTAIAGSPIAESAVAGVSSTATSLWESVQWGAGYAWGKLGLAAEWVVEALGFEGMKWTGAAATTKVLSAAGAGTAAVVATAAAVPVISHLQLSSNVPVDVTPSSAPPLESGLLATQGAQTAHAASHSALHEVAHAAHHAAESNSEHADHKNWSAKFMNKAAYASHADAARATTSARSIPLPAESFSAQLNADRANLDAALAK